MSRLGTVATLVIIMIVVNTLDQTVLSIPILRLIDLTMITILFLTISGLWRLAALAAVVAGLLRAGTTVYPWFVYGLAYAAGFGIAWLVIRRVVAERSTASLLAASSAGSVAYIGTLAALMSLSHSLDPGSPSIVWSVILPSGLAQILLQPLLVWFLWRLRGEGHFASVRDSVIRPF